MRIHSSDKIWNSMLLDPVMKFFSDLIMLARDTAVKIAVASCDTIPFSRHTRSYEWIVPQLIQLFSRNNNSFRVWLRWKTVVQVSMAISSSLLVILCVLISVAFYYILWQIVWQVQHPSLGKPPPGLTGICLTRVKTARPVSQEGKASLSYER